MWTVNVIELSYHGNYISSISVMYDIMLIVASKPCWDIREVGQKHWWWWTLKHKMISKLQSKHYYLLLGIKRTPSDSQVREEGTPRFVPPIISRKTAGDGWYGWGHNKESILMHLSIIWFSFYAMVLLYLCMYINKILMKTTL